MDCVDYVPCVCGRVGVVHVAVIVAEQSYRFWEEVAGVVITGLYPLPLGAPTDRTALPPRGRPLGACPSRLAFPTSTPHTC